MKSISPQRYHAGFSYMVLYPSFPSDNSLPRRAYLISNSQQDLPLKILIGHELSHLPHNKTHVFPFIYIVWLMKHTLNNAMLLSTFTHNNEHQRYYSNTRATPLTLSHETIHQHCRAPWKIPIRTTTFAGKHRVMKDHTVEMILTPKLSLSCRWPPSIISTPIDVYRDKTRYRYSDISPHSRNSHSWMMPKSETIMRIIIIFSWGFSSRYIHGVIVSSHLPHGPVKFNIHGETGVIHGETGVDTTIKNTTNFS